jgi:hypothetical protein
MTPDEEFQQECESFAAKTALSVAQSLPLDKRVMLYRGIITLLPPGSESRSIAEQASQALEQADRLQLRLFEILQP